MTCADDAAYRNAPTDGHHDGSARPARPMWKLVVLEGCGLAVLFVLAAGIAILPTLATLWRHH